MKITLHFALLLSVLGLTLEAQELNEAANWPNSAWTLSGNYDANYLDENPTVSNGSSSFSFNDDNAGGSSINNVAAESPIINLSNAFNTGETGIVVSLDYVLNVYQTETLRIQFWDADTATWNNFVGELTENSNANDNFCAATSTAYSTAILDISSFSVNQLENFKYRIHYNDNGAFGWGFCTSSPIISSVEPETCPSVRDLSVMNINTTNADVRWNSGGSETLWEIVLQLATASAPSTGPATNLKSHRYADLNPNTNYTVYVRANCMSDGLSNWQSKNFTTGTNTAGIPVSFTSNTFASTGTYDIAIVDLNGDYLDDVVSVGPNVINVHYQLHSGGYNNTEIATTTVANAPNWSLAAGDFDRNGYNDLLYGGGNGVTFMKANSDGTAYSEISGSEYVFSQRSNFVDINNDGHLDAFVCHDIQANVYYINDGSGNLEFYQGASDELPNGVGTVPGGGNYGTVWVDFDNDRDMDLFIAKCRGGSTTISTNEFWRNDGNGVFINVADSNNWYGSNHPEAGHNNSSNLGDNVQTWSAAWADFDNDGYMDVFVGASNATNGTSKLMKNNGDGTFTDITAGSGVLAANLGIENVAADFDNDGYIDILSNGTILFNNGDFTFTNVSTTMPQSGAIGDINNDGFLDVFQNGTIHVNNTNQNNWIKINTEGTESNINGIGARVEIETPAGIQIRDVRSGEGFKFMSSLNTHFGIGLETTINSITIYWPSGIVDYIPNPEINTTHTIVEGSALSVIDETLVDLAIYPNPVEDQLQIKTSADVFNKVATVFDSNGKRIFSKKLDSNSLVVSSLAGGLYFLRLESKGKVMTKKFIKK